MGDDAGCVVNTDSFAIWCQFCEVGGNDSRSTADVEDVRGGFNVGEEVFAGGLGGSLAIESGDGGVVSFD